MACILCSLRPCGASAGQEKAGASAAPAIEPPLKVTITTGGGLFGPVESRFKVGEDLPVAITLTNNGDKPAKFCKSTAVFQNRPQLERNGQTLPYVSLSIKLADKDETTRRCEMSAFRQFYHLQPGQKKVIDWITIGNRGINWYGGLPAGHYELV